MFARLGCRSRSCAGLASRDVAFTKPLRSSVIHHAPVRRISLPPDAYPGGKIPPTEYLAAAAFVVIAPIVMWWQWPATKSPPRKSVTLLEETPAFDHDTSEKNISEAAKEIEELLGKDGINSNLADRKNSSSSDWSPVRNVDHYPALILYPCSTEDVSQICKICSRRRIPITGYSGGTSLEGALAATEGGVVVDFRKMNKVLAVNVRDGDAVVQPGVGWQELNELLDKDGLFFPPDPGPGAQIGGMISTGCSGTNAYRYGTMKDWVISITAVLADGTVVKTRHRPRKSSAGYDLTRLFVGSSGTLGLVTEAVVKLTSKPQNVQVAVATFPSEQKAVDLAVRVIQNGMQLAAMELLDDTTMKGVNQSGYLSHQLLEKPTLFLKFSGTVNGVREEMATVEKLAKEEECVKFLKSRSQDEVDSLWQARKVALWGFLGMKRNPDDSFLASDVAVPVSKLAQLVSETKEVMNKSGLIGHALGHVGDGNVHFSVLFSESERPLAESIIAESQRKGVELEGTVTGEHGVGYNFRHALEWELSADTLGLMRQIKLAVDPHCILNCDKVIRMKNQN